MADLKLWNQSALDLVNFVASHGQLLKGLPPSRSLRRLLKKQQKNK